MNVRANLRAAACAMILLQGVSGAAIAENQMGYHLQSSDEASGFRRAGGSLGMRVGVERSITSGGLTFELLHVEGVGPNSPAGEAGFKTGDQIIAVDGRVFPSVATFAAYVGSIPSGRHILIDYMPAGGGPNQAQRVGVIVGSGGRIVVPAASQRSGLSAGQKIAIGAGAIAVFGCYEAGCFSRLKRDLDQQRDKLRKPNSGAPQKN